MFIPTEPLKSLEKKGETRKKKQEIPRRGKTRNFNKAKEGQETFVRM